MFVVRCAQAAAQTVQRSGMLRLSVLLQADARVGMSRMLGQKATADVKEMVGSDLPPVVISTVLPSRGLYSCHSTVVLPPVRQLYVQLSSNQPLLSFRSSPSTVTACG